MKTKPYLLLTFLTGILAYTLFFIFAVCYKQPTGGYSLIDSFFYGFILHIRLWFVVFMISGIFYKAIKKLKSINSTIKIIGTIIFMFLIAPTINVKLTEYFDYLVLIFYIFDFIFCYLIMVKTISGKKAEIDNK